METGASPQQAKNPQLQARRIVLTGHVQGVGFRPYIFRHAVAHRLHGWVRNTSGRVQIHVQGEARNLDAFINSVIEYAPPLSRPVLDAVVEVECICADAFTIQASSADENADVHVPADLFTCDDCLRELYDPKDRRYRYPFINCTQCGPRYTLIESLPYDRVNTSMSGFALCSACSAEYADPADRRYHAEPVACPVCGPQLSCTQAGSDDIVGNEASLKAALASIAAGKVVAVKGIGGYHLLCDACNDAAVRRLRDHKPRPHKPLAVLFPAPADDDLAILRRYLAPDGNEATLLQSSARPIVLVRLRTDSGLSTLIAPGLNEVGAMLPYSPLHHLLLNDHGAPLVATSANISGEPVLTDRRDVETRLPHVIDACLHHDRPIVRPADDPVIRVIDRRPSTIRTGRGVAPLELELSHEVPAPLLAVGAHMKNTIAIAWEKRAVISPHIGDMGSRRSLATFEQCLADLQALYQVEIEQILCDAHPGYTTTSWARQQQLPVHAVYHHHAHAASAWFDAVARREREQDMLVFAWDGVGLGPDGTLWGGEALIGRPGAWRRAAHFRPFRLPGGDSAGREPWRSAAAICWESGIECPLDEATDPLLYRFWRQGRNAPQTTAAGRLFDAAAALCGVCTTASFEGQGPMQLEAMAAHNRSADRVDSPAMTLASIDGVHVADWAPLIPLLMDATRSASDRAAAFHAAMAASLVQQATQIRDDTGVNTIGFTGGVFQNRVLAETAIARLRRLGFDVSLPLMIPVNDAVISFGQIIEYVYNRSGDPR